MFNGDAGQEEKIEKIIKWLSDLSDYKTHSRHFHYKECQENGLKIEMLEDGYAALQDLVLTVHHCFMLSLMNSQAYKIIENHLGRAMVKQIAPQIMLQMPPGLSPAAALGSPT
jgi:hypothetical protein